MFASASIKPNPEYMKIWKFIFNMYRPPTCNLNYWKNFFLHTCISAWCWHVFVQGWLTEALVKSLDSLYFCFRGNRSPICSNSHRCRGDDGVVSLTNKEIFYINTIYTCTSISQLNFSTKNYNLDHVILSMTTFLLVWFILSSMYRSKVDLKNLLTSSPLFLFLGSSSSIGGAEGLLIFLPFLRYVVWRSSSVLSYSSSDNMEWADSLIVRNL